MKIVPVNLTKAIASFVFITLFVVLITTSNINTGLDNGLEEPHGNFVPTDDTQEHSPISISGNVELVQFALDEDLDGNGTSTNPFLMQNYLIESDTNCITISNVNLHFRILSCHLTYSTSPNGGTAISFINTTNGVIVYTDISQKSTGISLVNSSNCYIGYNTICNNGEYGVYIDYISHHNTIVGNDFGWNSIENAKDDGYFNHWSGQLVEGNRWNDYIGTEVYHIPGCAGSVDRFPSYFERFVGSVDVIGPHDMEFMNNSGIRVLRWYIRTNQGGSGTISRDGKVSCWFSFQYAVDNWEIHKLIEDLNAGIHNFTLTLTSGMTTIIDNVTVVVHENPLQFPNFIVVDPENPYQLPVNYNNWIRGDDAFKDGAECAGWEGNGTEENPFIIEEIEMHSTSRCLRIENVSINFIIRNSVFGPSFYKFFYSAIELINTTGATIENCEIYGGPSSLSIINSYGCIIRNNTFRDNDIGVFIQNSTDITFENNTVTNSFDLGILLDQVNHSAFYNNTLKSNYYGMNLTQSDNNQILGNTFTNNYETGLQLDSGCYENLIFVNSFTMNDGENAWDDGNSNYWDDGVSIGNYWDDYDGSGTYSIQGSANSIDHYPIDYNVAPTSSTSTTSSTISDTTPTSSTGTISNYTFDNTILTLTIISTSVIFVVILMIVIFKRRA